MVLNLNKNLKLYHSIGEVAKMFGVNESTLRYWEKEIPTLRPKTSGPSMTRQYSDKDIEQIKIIHNLIKVRGFKINAARKILNSNPTGKDKTTEVLDRLIGIRNELQLMKKQLDGTFE
ncbi:MAG: MerR family transcriptional regulator [Prevotella sp.]